MILTKIYETEAKRGKCEENIRTPFVECCKKMIALLIKSAIQVHRDSFGL